MSPIAPTCQASAATGTDRNELKFNLRSIIFWRENASLNKSTYNTPKSKERVAVCVPEWYINENTKCWCLVCVLIAADQHFSGDACGAKAYHY